MLNPAPQGMEYRTRGEPRSGGVAHWQLFPLSVVRVSVVPTTYCWLLSGPESKRRVHHGDTEVLEQHRRNQSLNHQGVDPYVKA